jgi:hypothetical protein
MNIPQFTAQSSLYRTSNHYRSSAVEFDGSIPAQSVVAAYHPGPTTQYRCNKCLGTCAFDRDNCLNLVDTWISWWDPLAQLLYAKCYSDAGDCIDQCSKPPLGACCPKACGPLNPSNPGEGCCDTEDSCCGGTCCPPNLVCYDGGVCSDPPSPGFLPTTPPPPPTVNNCIFGGEPCGKKCCFGDFVCCYDKDGPVCRLPPCGPR